MFKNFASSIFQRRATCNTGCADKAKMTQSELQDLFRAELDMHTRTASQIRARSANRMPHALAA